MELSNYVVLFTIKYAGDLVFCEAVLQPGCYQIYFNGMYMADLVQDDAANWQQTNGRLLLQTTIDEVGAHIDGYLD